MTRLKFTVSTEVPRGKVVVSNCLAGVMDEHGDINCVRIRALWDTGSTDSAIVKKIADELNLASHGVHNVDTANGKLTPMSYSRNVCFVLVDGLTFTPRLTDVIDTGKDDDGNYIDIGFDAIIGMDIISYGTLTMKPADDGLDTLMTFTYESE